MGLTNEQLESMATCDWGNCDAEAITYRYDDNVGGYLPVCQAHSELGEQLAAVEAERDRALEAQAFARAETARIGGDIAAFVRRADRAEAERDRLREELVFMLRETEERMDISAPEDNEVDDLCMTWGYGAVMDSAARQWQRKDPVGAFVTGPCLGTLRSILTATPEPKEER